MKNKKNIYFLLPVVILVWGVLGYKIFGGLNPTVNQSVTVEPLGKFSPELVTEAVPFTIKAAYRDPFLGTLQQQPKKATTKRKPRVKKPTLPFPKIVYKGIVSPKGKNEKIFLILVNGQQHMFKRKSMFNDVKLLRGSSKEIIVQFQNQKQTFPLEK